MKLSFQIKHEILEQKLSVNNCSQQFLDGRRTEKVPDLMQLSGYGYMQEVAKHKRSARVALEDS